jgi:hypothetical protein
MYRDSSLSHVMVTVWPTRTLTPKGKVPILALLGILRKPGADARLLRFLAVYACAMALVYSLIPYKTPWCLLGPLHAMILLAGVAAASLLEGLRGRARIVAVICFDDSQVVEEGKK